MDIQLANEFRTRISFIYLFSNQLCIFYFYTLMFRAVIPLCFSLYVPVWRSEERTGDVFK